MKLYLWGVRSVNSLPECVIQISVLKLKVRIKDFFNKPIVQSLIAQCNNRHALHIDLIRKSGMHPSLRNEVPVATHIHTPRAGVVTPKGAY